MISRVCTVDYIVTKNEKEALILEDQLIKSIKPRYNIALKDDKSYPFLEITATEKYPVLKITRAKKKKAGHIYSGPFPNVKDIKEVKRIIDKVFPLRKCSQFRDKDRPCLNYQIGQCLAPCSRKVKEESYLEIIKEISLFLSGDHTKLLSRLAQKMKYFKNRQEYEQAAEVRDQIEELKKFFPIVNFRKIDRKRLETLVKIDPSYMLKDILGMENRPRIIEGYDISHTSSTQAVGSMVYFKDGEPDKINYRKFKIKQNATSDDLKMISEVVYRRLDRLLNDNKDLPDIMLIDGGRGQESAARKIVEGMKLTNIKVLSLAKENKNVYYTGKILKIEKNSEVYKLLKRITDEAHRFAHSYHIKRRNKSQFD